MLYLHNYASALRCVGQSLQSQNIEVFELQIDANEFRLQGGDPNPPYMALKRLSLTTDDIKVLDRAGRARRGQSNGEICFDSIPEILRAVGGYIDNQRGRLRRIDTSAPSGVSEPTVQVEYETRQGDLRSENLSMGFVREAVVKMYKRRTGLSNPVNFIARRG